MKDIINTNHVLEDFHGLLNQLPSAKSKVYAPGNILNVHKILEKPPIECNEGYPFMKWIITHHRTLTTNGVT